MLKSVELFFFTRAICVALLLGLAGFPYLSNAKDFIKKEVVVIVDGYSTGKDIVSGLRSYGYNVVHIKSSPDINKVYNEDIDHKYFITEIVYEGDIGSLLKKLSTFKIKFVIPASESGVILANSLSHNLHLPSNDPKKFLGLRDKYIMTKLVKDNGLKTVSFEKFSSIKDLVKWSKEINSWPLVIKPLKGAGGDKVIFCNNITELKEAYFFLKKSKDVFGNPNDEVLVQTYAEGQEYMANLVLLNKKLFVVNVFEVNKRGAAYDSFRPLIAADTKYVVVHDYLNKLVEALGIWNGAAHVEFKMSEDNIPVFIESGARIMGSADLSFQTEINGYNQLTILLESYFDHKNFFKRIENFKFEDDANKFGMNVALISNESGYLKRNLDLSKIIQLKTFHSFKTSVKVGSYLNKTVDLLSSPGAVHLISEDRTQLNHDYNSIRDLEQNIFKQAIQD